MTREEAVVWASGFYLCEHLPDDYYLKDEDDMDEFVVDKVWEPFERYDSDFLWEQIDTLADAAEKLSRGK